MTDRCDTPAYWFLFASCGRPFYYCPDELDNFMIVKTLRRRFVGSSLERREGNFAAATMDEALTCWGHKLIKVNDEHTFIQPCTYQEAA